MISAVGVAGAVAVMVGVLSVAQGFRATLVAGASETSVIVLRSGAGSELVSVLNAEEVRIVESSSEFRVGPAGVFASPELFLVLSLARREGDGVASATLRGVGPSAYRVRERFRILAGRPVQSGQKELVVGVAAQRLFAGLALGERVEVAGEGWPIVGVFESGGREESELWGDASILQALFRRSGSFQVVYATLRELGGLVRLREKFERDPRINVEVFKRSEYYAAQAATVTQVIQGLGFSLCLLMSIGAILAALDTGYAAVATRTREIATLRALGFRAGPVLAAILSESVLVAVAGGLFGASCAYLALDGFAAATLDFGAFSQVAFEFRVTSDLFAAGVGLSVGVGLVGGIPPGLQARRLPLATALRG